MIYSNKHYFLCCIGITIFFCLSFSLFRHVTLSNNFLLKDWIETSDKCLYQCVILILLKNPRISHVLQAISKKYYMMCFCRARLQCARQSRHNLQLLSVPSDLVQVITSKVITAFWYNLVKIFIMISGCVAYKTHDSRSKVKMCNLCLVRA